MNWAHRGVWWTFQISFHYIDQLGIEIFQVENLFDRTHEDWKLSLILILHI